ncbi:hypothetical protein QLS71_015895 [Mariniflexile litorale]|uniref:Cell shape-determining protein MreC n=1 Tax=Mariniflexile litorale TaxID=3045158 RepID=A0AAU7EES1_9FLAO|nr:hypothetical protein [Mariniflexile sp. KMM 9835]MDQ8212373.1 hypothetical protein [Mariniflexile sp. KMM 9835]
MLKFILIAVAAILLTIGLVKLVDKYIPSKFKPVINIALWVLIAFLGYQTYMSVYTPILFNQEKNKRYAQVIKNLIDIRDSELAYKQVNGKFTDSFDELVKFIETAKFTITQRRDSVVIDQELTKRYGVDTTKEIVIVDILGYVPVKDSLFKNSTRYKTMMNVPVGKPGEKFKLEAGLLRQNDINIPVFEASVKKDVILYDQDPDMVVQENQVVSVDGVNGDVLKVGSMSEVITIGNWPKTYGENE